MTCKNPPYDSRVVANTIISIALSQGDVLAFKRLMKLLFIAHGWHLAIYDMPLIFDHIEARLDGPLIINTYNEFIQFKDTFISAFYTRPHKEKPLHIPQVKNIITLDFLNVIWKTYGSYSANQLAYISQGTQLEQNKYLFNSDNCNILNNNTIKKYFQQFMTTNDSHIPQIPQKEIKRLYSKEYKKTIYSRLCFLTVIICLVLEFVWYEFFNS